MTIPNLGQDPTGQTWLLQSGLKAAGYDIEADNWRGPQTERALRLFAQSLMQAGQEWNEVKASSFADPADVRAFEQCKAQGGTDAFCFGRGDNGIGKWGHVTAQTTAPMCALPREIWQDAGKSGGAKVQVRYKGTVVDGILGDTMPRLANIKNGAGIDLNPGFSAILGLTPPFLVGGIEWRWA